MGSTSEPEPKIHVFYLRDEHGHPVTTVAFTSKLGRTTAGGTTTIVSFSLATRNPIDSLSKSTGRHIATGRLAAGKSQTYIYNRAIEKASEVQVEVVKAIAVSKQRRASIRARAAMWLVNYDRNAKKSATA